MKRLCAAGYDVTSQMRKVKRVRLSIFNWFVEMPICFGLFIR